MKIAVSTDERTGLVDAVLEELRKRGHDVEYFGPAPGGEADWPQVTVQAVERVVEGEADQAIVMCWTGTGCTLAANKVPGIRAALCHDAATAKGARIWNHANVLALSLRSTAEPVAREILETWLEDAVGYAKQRAVRTANWEVQAVSHKLAEMAMLVDISRQLVYRCAWLVARVRPGTWRRRS